ncbi:hypothetical protein RN001_011027 [Aquatica leii]|uniref:Protein HGH1 homolog n=1 Tax=Aquatica leii TaxID=1421715 RepID=A0AAN7S8T2_9COLE|nr:hypothetical protein RN001_011027 [Aquatica leii]
MENVIKDLITLISNDSRPDLRILTLNNILSFSGTTDGLKLITQQDLIDKIITLLSNKERAIKKTSALILVNISAYPDGSRSLLTNADAFTKILIESILDPNSEIADSSCMILSNLTRTSEHLEEIDVRQILTVFVKTNYNTKGQNLYYLGPVLSNLSQSSVVRKQILDKSENMFMKILPFVEFKDSVVKRGGVVGAIRNCCFETEYHDWLLNADIDILPRLLLPLAGNEEFDDVENDKLPLDLQYLPSDKERESDPDIRCMLLEAITQLCTLRRNRKLIRDQNTYIILRELHKWEKDRKALLACENLVDILIRTEEEIGRDNLQDTDIPEDLVTKFEQMDRDFLHDS